MTSARTEIVPTSFANNRMTILKIQAVTLAFENIGELSGSFIGTNQFSYQLAPFHPEHAIIFVIYCNTKSSGAVGGEINFKGQIVFYFDTETHKPTIDNLLELTDIGLEKFNELLEKEILLRTDIVPFKIFRSDREDIVNVLKQNLLLAYPDN